MQETPRLTPLEYVSLAYAVGRGGKWILTWGEIRPQKIPFFGGGLNRTLLADWQHCLLEDLQYSQRRGQR